MTSTKWRLCVAVKTLWQQQNNKYGKIKKTECTVAVADVFYIFNSTVVDWICFFFYTVTVTLGQYSHLYLPYSLYETCHVNFPRITCSDLDRKGCERTDRLKYWSQRNNDDDPPLGIRNKNRSNNWHVGHVYWCDLQVSRTDPKWRQLHVPSLSETKLFYTTN